MLVELSVNGPPTVFLLSEEPYDFPLPIFSSGGTVLLEQHLSIRASWEHKLFRASSAEEI